MFWKEFSFFLCETGQKKAIHHDGHPYRSAQITINCAHWYCTKTYILKCPRIVQNATEKCHRDEKYFWPWLQPQQMQGEDKSWWKLRIEPNNEHKLVRFSQNADEYAVPLAIPQKTASCKQFLGNNMMRPIVKQTLQGSAFWSFWLIGPLLSNRQGENDNERNLASLRFSWVFVSWSIQFVNQTLFSVVTQSTWSCKVLDNHV